MKTIFIYLYILFARIIRDQNSRLIFTHYGSQRTSNLWHSSHSATSPPCVREWAWLMRAAATVAAALFLATY